MIPGIVITVLTFPGVIVHEAAHAFFCRIFNRTQRIAFSICIVGLLVCSCSAPADVARVEQEVAHFRELMAAGRFQEIYSASESDLRNATSEKDFEDLLSAINRKLGSLKSSERLRWQTNYINGNPSVVLVFKSQYEQGEATEQFAYKLDGQTFRLTGYNINSNALVTR